MLQLNLATDNYIHLKADLFYIIVWKYNTKIKSEDNTFSALQLCLSLNNDLTRFLFDFSSS